MNLHQIVRGSISTVNPDVIGQWQKSAGYATAADGKRAPAYEAATPITVQEQALAADELEHIDSLNITGVVRGFWANGDLQGVNRTTNQGGDLLTVPSGTYLIVHVFETWSQAGWCHVAGQRQKV